MKKISVYFIAIIFLAFAEIVVVAAQDIQADTSDIHGLWVESHKHKVAVWIEDCGDKICGQIYWLKKALTADGLPKRDNHNPDLKLRSRFRCGLTILDGFSLLKKDHWGGGRIYNPSDGKTYSSKIHMTKEGALDIRGYIGLSLFGKTLTWIRPQQNMTKCSTTLN